MKLQFAFCLLLLLSVSVYSQETIRIPDVAFEEALIALKFDTNGLNGNILVSDAHYVVNLNIQDPLNNKDLRGISSKITDLTGIEHFSNLKRLNCQGNKISKLNLSKSTQLTFLNCSQNRISEIDVSNSPYVFFISCDKNRLTSLKLGSKPKLTELYANTNKLFSLNLTGCSVLETMDVSENNLKTIVVNSATVNKIPNGWYKDKKTTYTTNLGQTPVVASNEILQDKNLDTTIKPIKIYDEDFKKLIANEFDKAILNNTYFQQKKEELKIKHNLTEEDITKWLNDYSKLMQLKKADFSE